MLFSTVYGLLSKQTRNICRPYPITFILYNVGPTSKTLVQHCINVIQIFFCIILYPCAMTILLLVEEEEKESLFNRKIHGLGDLK